MLYRETVESRTFALLETLSEDLHLQHYFLVGGTALALQLGDYALLANFVLDGAIRLASI